jgi:hypothetical protein
MLINEILLENDKYGRTREITVAEFKKLLPQLEIAIKKQQSGDHIYRGSPNLASLVYSDPTGVERTSRNTSNELTLLVSHILPSWQNWPKRSRSLICSESYSTASSYGSGGPYIVLPIGNPNVGVVPASDFWDAFSMSPPTFNDNFLEFFRTFRLVAEEAKLGIHVPAAISSAQEMVQVLKTYDAVFTKMPQLVEKMKDELSSSRIYRIGAMINLLTAGDCISSLDTYFNPKSNNFVLTPYSDYSNHLNYEVWFSGPAVLVKQKMFNKLMN